MEKKETGFAKWEKDMIRYIFQNCLSSHTPEVHRFLMDRFGAYSDPEEALEFMRAWQHFEGWICCHGLDNSTMPEMFSCQAGDILKELAPCGLDAGAYCIRIKGGSQEYDTASLTRGKTIRLSRTGLDGKVHSRYVKLSMPVEIVRREG